MLHAFLDGRDTPPRSARASLEKAEALVERLGNGHVASICGRYYAMDRDRRWDRVSRAYRLLVRGEAPFHTATAVEGLEQAYQPATKEMSLSSPPPSTAAASCPSASPTATRSCS